MAKKPLLGRKAAANAKVNPGEKPWGKRMTDATQPAPMTLKQQIQRYVRQEVSQKAQSDGFESFEEADDFEDIESEPPWVSEFEIPETKDEDQLDLEGLDPIPDPPLEDAPPIEGEAKEGIK